MSKIPTTLAATLPFKLLLGLAVLVCVAAAPFGTLDRSEPESAKTLAFAGQLLEVGKGRWAVEGHAQLAIGLPLNTPSASMALMQEGTGGQPTEPTMGGSTSCPVSHTSCPQQVTLCPIISTACPTQETVCETTVCPATETVCPEVATSCQLTTCPEISTSCPTLATACPNISTLCPSHTTYCPQSQTVCPMQFTTCNTLETRCPVNPTVCERTVCPVEATHCPYVTTVCEFTRCNTDRESSCPNMDICLICTVSYQQGPPVGFVGPEVVADVAGTSAISTPTRAPRLTFLP